MKNDKIRILTKNSHWWLREGNTKWAMQDKKGHWWLVSGSESPEKRTKKKKKMNCGLPPTFEFKSLIWKLALAGVMGASIALNVFFIFLS